MPPQPKACMICGQMFQPMQSRQVACPAAACQEARRRQYAAQHWQAHRDRISRQRQEREAALTPEQREEQRRRATEASRRYWARKGEEARRQAQERQRQKRREQEAADQLILLQTTLHERLAGPVQSRPCLVCGRPVVGRRPGARYCSPECGQQAVTPSRPGPKPERIETPCRWCQQVFSRPKTARQAFCRPECRLAFRAHRKRGGRPPRAKRPPRQPLAPTACAVCGQTFQPDRHNARTCGPECRRRYKVQLEARRREQGPAEGETPCTCAVCGKPFQARKPTLVCSPECLRLHTLARARKRLGVVQPRCAVCDTPAPWEAAWPSGKNSYLRSPECRREHYRRKCREHYQRRRGKTDAAD